MKEVVKTNKAPGAIGPYSQGILSGPFVFFSGQIPLDPATGEVIGETIEAQSEQVLKNIAGLLEAVGLSFQNVVKSTVFLRDMGDFAAFNAVYGQYMTEPFPARSTVAVAGLPKNVRIEIEVIATR